MNMSRKLAYNKKGSTQLAKLNARQNMVLHLIYVIRCYFFIIRIIKEPINKMIINIKNEINKSFFFMLSRLLP